MDQHRYFTRKMLAIKLSIISRPTQPPLVAHRVNIWEQHREVYTVREPWYTEAARGSQPRPLRHAWLPSRDQYCHAIYIYACIS